MTNRPTEIPDSSGNPQPSGVRGREKPHRGGFGAVLETRGAVFSERSWGAVHSGKAAGLGRASLKVKGQQVAWKPISNAVLKTA